MKNTFVAACGLVIAFSICRGQDGMQQTPLPIFTLVKIVDIDGTTTFQVLQADELKTLIRTVEEEKKALPRAYNYLRNEWKKKNTPAVQPGQKKPRTPPFPLSRMPPPKELKKLGTYTNEGIAASGKIQAEGKETERLQKIKDKEEKSQASAARSAVAMIVPAAQADPEEIQELYGKLSVAIQNITLGLTPAGDPISSGESKGGTGKVRRLGDDLNTPLIDNPFKPLVDDPKNMMK